MVVFSQLCYAQRLNTLKITGKVIDINNKPLEFCTATLLKATDSTLVRSSLTNSEGIFLLENISAGQYILAVTSIGYIKYIGKTTNAAADLELNPIVLQMDTKALKEVVIVSKKPLFEQQLDKLIINVQNSITSVGTNAADILENAPGVSMLDGKVSLKGRSGVNVLIDGKPTHLSSADLANRLQSMNSSLIDKIEIIENPSSKYDAAGTGGIINIITKKNQTIGLNGNLGSGVSRGVYNKYNNSINLNYRNKKFNAYGNYSLASNKYLSRTHLHRADVLKFLEAEGERRTVMNNNSFAAGLDYSINKKSILGVLVKGFSDSRDYDQSTFTSIHAPQGAVDSTSSLSRTGDRQWNNIGLNLNYKITLRQGEELSIDLDRSIFTGQTRTDILSDFSYTSPKVRDPYISNVAMPSNLEINSVKIDYSRPFAKGRTFDCGLKYSYVSTDNDVVFNLYTKNQWEIDKGKTNHFIYDETINAAYVNYKHVLGKLQFQVGLRGEQTISKGNSVTLNSQVTQNYFKLFPTAFATYEISKQHKINSAYSRRIGRPAYNQLNPFTYFVDNYNYYYGNPYIAPSYTNSFSFNHIYKDVFLTSLNYSRTTDYISYAYYMETQADSSQIWIETTDNLSAFDNLSLSLSSPIKITSFWTTNNNLVFVYNNSRIVYRDVDIKNSRPAYRFNTTHSISLPRQFKAEVSASYSSLAINGFWAVLPRTAMNVGLRKTFLNNKANINLNIADVFNTMRLKSTMTYNAIDVTDFTKVETRLFRINLTYQFGKSQIKPIKQRTTGTEDEQKRVGY